MAITRILCYYSNLLYNDDVDEISDYFSTFFLSQGGLQHEEKTECDTNVITSIE